MDKDTLKEIAEQKEKEWRLIQEQRIEVLEKGLSQKTKELKEEKEKLDQLKEDFKYNLKLLEERDSELEKYEQSLLSIRKQLSDKNGEISDLKIKIDEFKKCAEHEKNSVDEIKKYYMNRLNQKNAEIDKYKAAKDAEINQERSEIEKLKRTLQLQIQDLQYDLDKQRDELKNEFDQLMKKREHEYRLQVDEFNTQYMAKDLEIKMLKNELNQKKEECEKTKAVSESTETIVKSVERKLKEKEWELKDTVALKDAKIKDLESKLENIENKTKSIAEEFSRKNEEKEKLLGEKEMCIENLKKSLNDERLVKLNLEEQLNEYKFKIKPSNMSSSNENELKSKIEYLNKEIESLKFDLDKQVEINKAKKIVSNDLNQNYLTELDLLKNELKLNLDRINKLEKEKVEINLEWQRKYFNLEKLKVQDSDLINKEIIESREQAYAQIKTLEEKLAHKESVIKTFISADPLGNHINQIESLNEMKYKEENEKLKQIIKQMRKEVEALAASNLELNKSNDQNQRTNFETLPRPKSPVNNILPKNDFEEDLKRQLLETKQKNRELQSKIDEYVLKQKFPDGNLTDNTILNSHMKSLNETINILRKEKVDLTAYCKKQQTKLIHLEKQLSDQNEKERMKQTQLETLKYEMSSQERRLNTEINNLKQNLANLELELNSTRREADEYHKATIEKNSEISSLENKISELNLKLSTHGTQINFGAQELFIEQLKGEIKRLSTLNQQLQIKARQLNHQLLRIQQENQNSSKTSRVKNNEHVIDSEEISDEYTEDILAFKKENENLKIKLKTAAKFITNLIQEKEHLIEMSNQLRGELNRIKFDNDSLALLRINRENQINELFNFDPSSASSADYKPPSQQRPKTPLSSRLEQLEKKQYELTKQQLTFAKQKNLTKSDPVLSKTTHKSPYKEKNYTDSTSAVTSTDETNTISSSVRSDNLKEIWKILDENQNDSVLGKIDDLNSPIKVSSIKPQTKKVSVISKSPRKTPSSSSAVPSNTKTIPKPKIRNYNIKN